MRLPAMFTVACKRPLQGEVHQKEQESLVSGMRRLYHGLIYWALWPAKGMTCTDFSSLTTFYL